MSKDFLEIVNRAVDKAKSCGADAADAVIFSSQDVNIRQRLGNPEHIERAESEGLGLRVLLGGKGGYSQAIISSTDVSDKAIDKMVDRAIDMAKVAPIDKYAGLADAQLFAKGDVDLDLFDANEPEVETLKDWAAQAESAAMEVDGVNNSEGSDASYSSHLVALATSEGFCDSYNSSTFAVSASVVAGDGAGKETDYDYSVAHHASDMKDAQLIGKTAGQRTVRKLKPRKVKTCQVTIVYESRVARSLLTSFASAINGASVAKGTTFLTDKMGQQLFSSDITIHDNPLRKRGLGSEPFDAEGVRGKDLKIIDNGVLTSWLLDIRSANKLGLKTTGHGSRDTSSMPRPSRSNFYMEAGKIEVKELISDIKSGFFVTDTFGMGVNGVTGDYSQGAAGFWIENGVISYPVSEITIAGNLLDMFKNLTPADDLEFNFATNSPTVRIEGMTVAGT